MHNYEYLPCFIHIFIVYLYYNSKEEITMSKEKIVLAYSGGLDTSIILT